MGRLCLYRGIWRGVWSLVGFVGIGVDVFVRIIGWRLVVFTAVDGRVGWDPAEIRTYHFGFFVCAFYCLVFWLVGYLVIPLYARRSGGFICTGLYKGSYVLGVFWG